MNVRVDILKNLDEYSYVWIIREDSAFIVNSEVVENVEERSVLEVVSEVSILVVCRHQCTEPIISDDEGRLNLELAKNFQTSFSDSRNLGQSTRGIHLKM